VLIISEYKLTAGSFIWALAQYNVIQGRPLRDVEGKKEA
jgi:hypothetical protein